MRLLLDTHVAIWWLLDDPVLAEEIRDQIDVEPEVYISAATHWEIAIKQNIGKLGGPTDVLDRVIASELIELPITARHGAEAGRLPMHHRDPFDRLLIAQATCEGLVLMTRDPAIRGYDVAVLPV